jgi:hypothetical protein
MLWSNFKARTTFLFSCQHFACDQNIEYPFVYRVLIILTVHIVHLAHLVYIIPIVYIAHTFVDIFLS